MPSFTILKKRDALALERTRHDHRWAAFHCLCSIQGGQNLFKVVSIYRAHLPTKRGKPLGIDFNIMVIHRSLTLPETIDVNNGNEIIQLVIRRERRSFPDAAFGNFSVAEQDVHSVIR